MPSFSDTTLLDTLIMTTIGWLMCEMLALLTIQAVYSKNGKIVHSFKCKYTIECSFRILVIILLKVICMI